MFTTMHWDFFSMLQYIFRSLSVQIKLYLFGNTHVWLSAWHACSTSMKCNLSLSSNCKIAQQGESSMGV